MTPTECIGSLYIENRSLIDESQRLLAEYKSLLSLVERIRVGEVAPSQIRVDLDKVSWALVLGEEPTNDDAT
jgi:hypothetical protein